MRKRRKRYGCTAAKPLGLDILEDRRMLATLGAEITNLQKMANGVEQVSVVVTDQGTAGDGSTSSTGVTGLVYSKVSQDYSMSLLDAFQDANGSLEDLVFSVSESGDDLFETLLIDSTTGELIVELEATAEGSADLTVVATDANGNTATATFGFSVDQLSGVAEFDSISTVLTEEGDLVITGTIDMNGADPADLSVEFGIDLQGQSTEVDSDGSFQLTVDAISIGSSGTASATIYVGEEEGDSVTIVW